MSVQLCSQLPRRLARASNPTSKLPIGPEDPIASCPPFPYGSRNPTTSPTRHSTRPSSHGRLAHIHPPRCPPHRLGPGMLPPPLLAEQPTCKACPPWLGPAPHRPYPPCNSPTLPRSQSRPRRLSETAASAGRRGEARRRAFLNRCRCRTSRGTSRSSVALLPSRCSEPPQPAANPQLPPRRDT